MTTSAVFSFIFREFKKILPPTIFFGIGFNLILFTTNLLLGDYQIHLSSYLIATTAALVVGKAVLVANALPFFHHLNSAPLIQSVLFKSGIYFTVVAIARFLEKLIEFLLHGGRPDGLLAYIATHFTWNRFFAIQIWIAVLFLIYTYISELSTLFGDGELFRILFIRRPTALKEAHRMRFKTLVKLGRLIDTHTADELLDPKTAVHSEMNALIRSLSAAAPGQSSTETRGA
ncbi:hypothetical protein HLH34_14265 [Gluconacetobacter azotocaptans]|uniref:Uncharacterized protein n=1 Tax=Gluconacetobacter azotocaptans TaxID=142834 RepID=A0A7W4PE95_9PROT|nr:hypothetical protein [Gluconacetobacter azotocaptans]MBB2191112.1 hypothetical protein [Gluconacetobacter azotocaptans]MBM9402277.1 hypothetical protein [Gluconacetobacter azotocaptans]GBQ33162.1 hypothetical protein AA13594_2556 [Gluconacetobacter azotocaptans DSM 13594]